MSTFNYPDQINNSVYSKTIYDYDYNRILNYLINNTDWTQSLYKLRNNKNLGIDSFTLSKKTYEYTLLLRYFSNLSNYCKKATVSEKNNIYCNFISCIENLAICKSNPKMIRDLADLICINPPTECGISKFDSNSVYLNSENKIYKINNFDYNFYNSYRCFYYKSSTLVVEYYDNSLNYSFKDKDLLIIGQGIHIFVINRRETRTLYFLINSLPSTSSKTLNIRLSGYIGEDEDLLDPSNVFVGSSYFNSTNQVYIKTLDIVYDNNTDITTYTWSSTLITNNVEKFI